jgi:hypothetical protein
MRPERMTDLDHPDEIEIRRLTASSRAEAEDIKAELERRGFTVLVREMGCGALAPGLYQADIFAEKRTVPTEAELASRRASLEKEERVRRRDYRLILIGLGVVLALGLLYLASILGPLLSLIRAILD